MEGGYVEETEGVKHESKEQSMTNQGHKTKCWLTRTKVADKDKLSTVYAVHDEGFEEDGAVVGYASLLVDHSGVGECALVLLMRQD